LEGKGNGRKDGVSRPQKQDRNVDCLSVAFRGVLEAKKKKKIGGLGFDNGWENAKKKNVSGGGGFWGERKEEIFIQVDFDVS